ncbi:hypothetical protein TWF718_010149 [Orbilia javanica]|uniref:Uncharacterized protein n=1 Tax=Orbilia javanica TaxID=47235 RepID=A0AAN8MLH1_9PEZI
MTEMLRSNIEDELQIDELLKQTLKENWGKRLIHTTQLIGVLGKCVMLASKPEMKDMQLDDKHFKYSSLIVNLEDVSTQGEEAFSKAHVDSSLISSRAYRVAKKDGLIDEVITGYGPIGTKSQEARRRAQLALEKLDAHVKESAKHGKETEEGFAAWKKQIEALKNATRQKQTYGFEANITTSANI